MKSQKLSPVLQAQRKAKLSKDAACYLANFFKVSLEIRLTDHIKFQPYNSTFNIGSYQEISELFLYNSKIDNM